MEKTTKTAKTAKKTAKKTTKKPEQPRNLPTVQSYMENASRLLKRLWREARKIKKWR